MVSQQEKRLVHICVILLVVLVFTSEYMWVVSAWRHPSSGYRILLGTLAVFTISSELEGVWGEGFLCYVPRSSVCALAANFAILEAIMFWKKKVHARKMRMRIHVEQTLAEDLFPFE